MAAEVAGGEANTVDIAIVEGETVAIAVPHDFAVEIAAVDTPEAQEDILLDFLLEEGFGGDSCCTEHGACPMGVPGAPLDQACECILGNDRYAGVTCEDL